MKMFISPSESCQRNDKRQPVRFYLEFYCHSCWAKFIENRKQNLNINIMITCGKTTNEPENIEKLS